MCPTCSSPKRSWSSANIPGSRSFELAGYRVVGGLSQVIPQLIEGI
jgi:hypothetical protein